MGMGDYGCRIVTGMIILFASVAFCAELSEEFDVKVPLDGYVTGASSITLIVESTSTSLEVKLNGKKIEPFAGSDRYSDFSHGRIDLVPGSNALTVGSGSAEKSITIKRMPYFSSGELNGEKTDEFHEAGHDGTCRQCHELTVNESTRKPVSRQDSICNECHARKTQAEYLHGPLGAYRCFTCHQEKSEEGKGRFAVIQKESELCGKCHETALKTKKKAFVHGPLGAGYCGVCHDPHGSGYKYQLHADEPSLCFNCHEDMKKETETSVTIHAVIQVQGCTVCHDPHSADDRFFLKTTPNELCWNCHDKKIYAHLKHPIFNHPVEKVQDPLDKESEMSCVSCHAPHFSNAKGLLKAGDYQKLCSKCHSI